MTPVREAVVWDRELPAFIITHTVADFDSWLGGYDDADELRISKGIIGHAANRSMDDPSLVVVYHQAESFNTLRAFLSDPDLKTAMEAAGRDIRTRRFVVRRRLGQAVLGASRDALGVPHPTPGFPTR